MSACLTIVEQMVAHYNTQDADAYVALMSIDAAEAFGVMAAYSCEGEKRSDVRLIR